MLIFSVIDSDPRVQSSSSLRSEVDGLRGYLPTLVGDDDRDYDGSRLCINYNDDNDLDEDDDEPKGCHRALHMIDGG